MQENVQPVETPVDPQVENNSTQTKVVIQEPKSNIFLVVLLSILLLIALVIAGFFAYQTQRLVNELQIVRNEELVTPTPVVSTEPTTDPTADWKIYSNEEFSFKYPSDWKIEGRKLFSPDSMIESWVHTSKDSLYNECMNLDKTEIVGDLRVKSFVGITTGKMCDPVSTSKLLEKWIVKIDGEGFAPGLQYSFRTNDSEAVEIFNQILSTFKFIN